MGSLQSKMRVSKEYQQAAAEYWAAVGRAISPLKINKVYQDGLPDVPEDEVNRVVTTAQTPNYEILRILRLRGALIRGTEDPALLAKEASFRYRLAYPQDEEDWAETVMAYHEERENLLTGRDLYICQRIESDLMAKETGILFIGDGHNVANLLDQSINILTIEQLCHPLAEAKKALSRETKGTVEYA